MERLAGNTKRYKELFEDAVDEIIQEIRVNYDLEEDDTDVMLKIRQEHLNREGAVGGDKFETIPKELTRKFELHVKSATKTKASSLRDVKTTSIGQLVTIKAMVTKVSDVKPQVTVATYTCDDCGYELYQTVNSKAYLPLTDCVSAACTTNGNKGKLYHQTRQSKFEKYQEIKIQELPEQVPVGNIPRTMNLICRGEMVWILYTN
jgi:DNA replication licensing factor MCM7